MVIIRVKGKAAKIWPAEDANIGESLLQTKVPNEEELEEAMGEEEVFAHHSDVVDCKSFASSGLEGLHLNERFEEDPQGYLAEKVEMRIDWACSLRYI